MASLTQRLTHLSRALRPRSREPIAWGRVLSLSLALLALELCGRFAPNDFVDALGVAGLLLLGSAVWARRSRRTRARLRLWGAGLRRWLFPRVPRLGLDLRGDPPLRPELPPLFAAGLCATALLALVVETTLDVWPTAARAWLRDLSGLAWLAALTCLWSLLLAGTFFFFAVPLAYLDAWLDSSRRWRPRRPRLVPPVGLAAFLGLGAAAQWLPVSWALALLGATYLLFASAILFCPYSQVQLAWSRRDRPLEVRALPWRVTNLVGGLWFVVLIATISGLATGERWSATAPPDDADAVFLTSVLGLAFTWTACAATAWFLCLQTYEVLVNTLDDPARPVRLRVRIRELPPQARTERKQVRAALAELGFRAAFGSGPLGRVSPADAELLWRPGAVAGIPDSYPPPPAWPRPFSQRDVATPAARETLGLALRRRAQIVHRRQIRNGLEQALKDVRRHSFKTGSGFWIGPQLWFLYHVTRDSGEDGQWFLGPPYRKLIPRSARHHLWTVLRAVQIDLIFLEDGVGHRRFLRVLTQLFEYWDLFGERPLEERHFQGLPGVRVWIHAMPEAAQPSASTGYPEPDYAEIGRARILHVFRDRGGHEERESVPSDSSRFPIPSELLPA